MRAQCTFWRINYTAFTPQTHPHTKAPHNSTGTKRKTSKYRLCLCCLHCPLHMCDSPNQRHGACHPVLVTYKYQVFCIEASEGCYWLSNGDDTCSDCKPQASPVCRRTCCIHVVFQLNFPIIPVPSAHAILQLNAVFWTSMLRRNAGPLIKYGWLLLHVGGSLRPIVRMLQRASPLYREVWFYAETNQPIIAITVDDSPAADSSFGHAVLDILKESGIQCTFFVIAGQITDVNEDVVQRMVSEGHELANHMCHDKPYHWVSEAEFEVDLLQCEQTLARFQPVPPGSRWFRPPCGMMSHAMLQVLKRHEYRIALCDVHNMDVDLQSDPQFLKDFLLKYTQHGSILVVHFPSRGFREANLEVLRQVAPHLKERFQCVTLSDLVHSAGGSCESMTVQNITEQQTL